MRFTPQFLDELKARLPVSEVVGRRVKLVRSGREFKGLSPFNKEKTPSFFVNDQKQAWFDFSSGKNGSIFDFVMQSEGVSFPRRWSGWRRWPACRCRKFRVRTRRARAAQDAARCDGARGEILSRTRWPRAPARRRAAISPTAASIRRRSSNSASAMQRASALR